ncbi:unnamed protein product [Paramecium sonneborni]|uniref:Uncharacterized protein n=1 Tax=Paramecium sonneborni TaxID=65129 RepID=A0A8S1RTY7_9CILI|nr:unnamed protein product [Paramecium sonneborni]
MQIKFLIFICLTAQQCRCECQYNKHILRGYYRNIMHQNSGVLLEQRNSIWLHLNQVQGLFFRDSIEQDRYTNLQTVGYTSCLQIMCKIRISLLQNFEINTLRIWMWDGDVRSYKFSVYAISENKEKLISIQNAASGVTTICFPDQHVKEFVLYNLEGNTRNIQFHIIKIEAFYQFK